jgi:hypothetical protein
LRAGSKTIEYKDTVNGTGQTALCKEEIIHWTYKFDF